MANPDAFREKVRPRPAVNILLCDLGNVLVDWRRHAEIPDFMSRCNVGPEEIARFFSASEEFFEYERGKAASAEFFSRVRRALGYSGDYGQFTRDFCDIFTLKKDVYSFLFLETKPAFDMEFWITSNINELHYHWLCGKWPGIFANCRRLFLSCEMGRRKPEPEFWQKVLEYGSPYNMGLIDDLEENGESAKKFGISFIRFTGFENLKQRMKSEWGIGK